LLHIYVLKIKKSYCKIQINKTVFATRSDGELQHTVHNRHYIV